jgi:hypothetical protein
MLFAGQAVGFRDTALAYYSAPTMGSANNQATLDTMAGQFAEDSLSWFVFSGDSTLDGNPGAIDVGAIRPNCRGERAEWASPIRFPVASAHFPRARSAVRAVRRDRRPDGSTSDAHVR